MPRFIIERDVPDPKVALDGAIERYQAVAESMPGVKWIRSYVSEAEGKVYCEFEAPDIEIARECQIRAQLPFSRISLVSLELSPAMFK